MSSSTVSMSLKKLAVCACSILPLPFSSWVLPGQRPGLYFSGLCLPKAASTSSFLIRAVGSPRSLRFCSSVPSPIMPGWETSAFLLGSLGTAGLFVISNTPRRLLLEARRLRWCENQACTCLRQIRIRIGFARQGDQRFREGIAHFIGIALVRHDDRCSCLNIGQCTELVCADGRQHSDDRLFRTRACQFFGRILAHEAETVREQEHTYDDSTYSCPQRGFYDFPIDFHWALLLFEIKYCTPPNRGESEQNCSLPVAPHSSIRSHSFRQSPIEMSKMIETLLL